MCRDHLIQGWLYSNRHCCSDTARLTNLITPVKLYWSESTVNEFIGVAISSLAKMPGANTDGGLVVPRPSADISRSSDIGLSVTSTVVNGSSWNATSRTDSRAPGVLNTQPSMATLVNGNDGNVVLVIPELEGKGPSEQLEILKELLEKTTRLKEGAENFLKMELTVSCLH